MLDGAEISSCALRCLQCKIETARWFCNVEEQLDRQGLTANCQRALNGLIPGIFSLFIAFTLPLWLHRNFYPVYNRPWYRLVTGLSEERWWGNVRSFPGPISPLAMAVPQRYSWYRQVLSTDQFPMTSHARLCLASPKFCLLGWRA